MKVFSLLKFAILLVLSGSVFADIFDDEISPVDSGNCSFLGNIESDKCSYVLSHCGSELSGYVNYLSMYYCKFERLGSFSIFPLLICLMVLFVWLGLAASDYLCPNLYTISKALNLSDNLAGLTLLALGNASPDVLGTFQAMNMGYGSLAISELMGAALFITSVVVGSMALIRPFSVPKDLFMRDVGFFLCVSILLLTSLVDSRLSYINCLTLVIVYVVYVLYVLFEHSSKKRVIRTRLREQRARGHHSVTEGSNEQVDTIYLDNISSLPTIDEIPLNKDSCLGSLTGDGNNQDLHNLEMLIRELDNNNHRGEIRLEIDGPSSPSLEDSNNHSPENLEEEIGDYSAPNESDYLNIDNIGSEDSISIYSYESMRINIFRAFNDKLNFHNFWNLGVFNQIHFIVSLFALIILNLTNPVVEHTFISDLKHTIRAQIDILNEPQETPDPLQSKEESIKISLQLFFGINFVIYMVFSDLKYYHVLSLPLGILVSFGIAYSFRWLYHYNLTTMLYVSYFVSFVGFLVSISWIAIFAAEIIGILKTISTIYGLSQEILGVTVFALGNCIGDFISNVTVARMGVPVMAIGACFGGPLLAISSIGVSGLIIIRNQELINGISVDFSGTTSITCYSLIFNIIFLLILVPRNKWVLDRKIGIILVCNWLVATTLSIISEFY